MTHTGPADFERTATIYTGSGGLQYLPPPGLLTASITGVIWVKLKTERNYAGLQAAHNHLTHSQMGSQPVSKAVRARRKRWQQREAK